MEPPKARMAIGNDMPADTCYNVMEFLSEPLGPEWEQTREIVEQKNKECWSRACGLWNRPGLRPKINAEEKKNINPRATQMNAPSATPGQLDVAIPPTAGNDVTETTESLQTMTSQEFRGEHSPEPLTFTSVVNLLEADDGLHTPEGAVTQKQLELRKTNGDIARKGHT